MQYQIPVNLTCSKCVILLNFTEVFRKQGTFFTKEFNACAHVDVDSESDNSNDKIKYIENLVDEVHDEVTESDFDTTSVTEIQANSVKNENSFDEIILTYTTERESLTSSPAVSRSKAGASTIASIVNTENRTTSTEPLVNTIENVELISDKNIVEHNEGPMELIDSAADLKDEFTANKGVIEILMVGSSSPKYDVNMYTTAPDHPLEYSLVRTEDDALGDMSDEEDKLYYKITRTKPPKISDGTISSPPAIISSATPLYTPITYQQTTLTDLISEPTTMNTVGESLPTTKTTIGTTAVKTHPITVATLSSSSVNSVLSTVVSTAPNVITASIESVLTTTKLATTRKPIVANTIATISVKPIVSTDPVISTYNYTAQPPVVFIGTPTTTTPTTTIPTTTTPTTTTPTTTTPTTTTPTTTTISTTPVRTSTGAILSSEKKFGPSAKNSISLVALQKNPKVSSIDEDNSMKSNTTVIYQVYSSGPSVSYGLVLSVPPTIIVLICVILVYMKKKYEVTQEQEKPQNQTDGATRTLYHSVPKDDMEEGDVSQLTNMTSSTTLITHEFTPDHPTMCPEYAYIPDVVPSSVRNIQRQRLNDSVEESVPPRNSLPNLSKKSTNKPSEDSQEYPDPPVVQYSSLNELNSNENSPQPGDISSKRWQSSGFEAEKSYSDPPAESWNSQQRWKSEDWEKDQSFIAMLAKRLEHVDSRAEVTEL